MWHTDCSIEEKETKRIAEQDWIIQTKFLASEEIRFVLQSESLARSNGFENSHRYPLDHPNLEAHESPFGLRIVLFSFKCDSGSLNAIQCLCYVEVSFILNLFSI